MSIAINLPQGQHVDIHLTNGVLARGVVAATDDEIVVLEHRPALHSRHGNKAFEKIMIDRKHIVAVGFNQPEK